MSNKPRLIGLDMDGTVLTDDKVLLPEVAAAIHGALAAGVETAFCTGRSLAEMRDILADFPDMRYLCLESGAFLYDAKEGRALRTESIDRKTRIALRDAAAGRDIMPQVFMNGECYMNAAQIPHCLHYQMEAYQSLYDRVATPVEDVLALAAGTPGSVEKINLFHTCPEDREKTAAMLQGQDLPAQFAYAEISSLETSPAGLTKARGLQGICDAMGITLQDAAMVGDADNDLAAMEAVGLPVAMGNGNERVKAAAKIIVPDNAHAGCAEAIRLILETWGISVK